MNKNPSGWDHKISINQKKTFTYITYEINCTCGWRQDKFVGYTQTFNLVHNHLFEVAEVTWT